MGNSSPSQKLSNSTDLKNNSNKSVPIETNDDKIFNYISDISNKLLLAYNNQYLKSDFCSKISILYEKKLSNFNIKLLKSLNDKINSNEVDQELLMTIQYLPQNDEKFEDMNNFFSDNLKEYFWSKNIKYNFNDLLNKNSNINKEDTYKLLKSLSSYYINQEHVNELLNTISRKNTNSQTNNTVNLSKQNLKENKNNTNNRNNRNNTMNLSKHSEDKELFSGTLVKENT